MQTPLVQRLLTSDEYQKMVEAGILTEDDRVELLDGKIIEMSPAGYSHVVMVIRLTTLFSKLLGEKAFMSIQNPLVVGSNSVPEPDLAILKNIPGIREGVHPKASDVLLVIEVADSSLDRDRIVKRPLYAAAGIPEYWIINLERNEVEVYRDPEGEEYRLKEVVKAGGEIEVVGLGVKVKIGDLFV